MAAHKFFTEVFIFVLKYVEKYFVNDFFKPVFCMTSTRNHIS